MELDSCFTSVPPSHACFQKWITLLFCEDISWSTLYNELQELWIHDPHVETLGCILHDMILHPSFHPFVDDIIRWIRKKCFIQNDDTQIILFSCMVSGYLDFVAFGDTIGYQKIWNVIDSELVNDMLRVQVKQWSLFLFYWSSHCQQHDQVGDRVGDQCPSCIQRTSVLSALPVDLYDEAVSWF